MMNSEQNVEVCLDPDLHRGRRNESLIVAVQLVTK